MKNLLASGSLRQISLLLFTSFALTAGLYPAKAQVLVPRGSVWKYLDNGSDQGTTWRAPAFDDSAWASGLAQLGFGDGDEVTVISGGPDPTQKNVTTYFRRSFDAPATNVLSLILRVLRDDGAVVYINGLEVFRSNMPDGPITYNTLASLAVGGPEESTQFVTANISPAVLVPGANTIAVEIHQNSPLSSDLSFDLELEA